MNYNYRDIEAYARKNNIFLMQDKLEEFDQLAFAHGFTQAQVDVSMQCHIRHIAWIFNPKNWTLKQRIALAFWYLFGRRKTNVP